MQWERITLIKAMVFWAFALSSLVDSGIICKTESSWTDLEEKLEILDLSCNLNVDDKYESGDQS